MLIAFSFNALAQDSAMVEVVTVSQEYNPTVKEAFKISTTPVVEQPESYTPVFEYNFFNVPLKTEYKTQYISADEYKPNIVNHKGKRHYVKGGGGNYSTLMGEIFINAYEDKKQKLNVFYKNRSSWGKVRLQDDTKVKAPNISNYGLADLQTRFKKSVLNTSFEFDRLGYNHYGYNTLDKNKTYSYVDANPASIEDSKQTLTSYALNAQYKSLPSTRSDIDYKIDFAFNSLINEDLFSENELTIGGGIARELDKLSLGIDIASNAGFYGKKMVRDSISERKYLAENYFDVDIAPFIAFYKKKWELKAGLKFEYLTQGGNYDFLLTPIVEYNANIIDKYFSLFAKANGGIKQNTYADVVRINPYVANDIDRQITREILHTSIGFIWQSTKALSVKASADYQILRNQMFFVNEFVTDNADATNITAYTNRFVAEYHNNNIVNPRLEVSYNPYKTWSVNGAFDYYYHSLNNISTAWNMPEYKISLFGHYDLSRNIRATAMFDFLPGRNVKVSQANDVEKTPCTYDLTLKGEYRFRDYLSFFLDLNNILGSKHYYFNGYTAYRANVLVGATFRF